MGSGSSFFLTARDASALLETAEAVAKINEAVECVCFEQDAGQPDKDKWKVSLEQFASSKREHLAAAFIFHNAGSIGEQQKARDIADLDEMQSYFSTNLFSVMMLNSIFMKTFPESCVKSRFVINISSKAGVVPIASWSYYCTGKAARDMLLRVLAAEEPNLRVLNYAPGPVRTKMVADVRGGEETEPSIKKMFADLDENGQILETEQTVAKLIKILTDNTFESGSHIDYFDYK